jgi:hypothetical protein
MLRGGNASSEVLEIKETVYLMFSMSNLDIKEILACV